MMTTVRAQRSLSLLVRFALLAAAGCGDGGGGGGGGGDGPGPGDAVQSCDRKSTAGTCTDFTGDGWTEEEKARACPQGMLKIVPCSSAGAVGVCLVQPDAPDELQVTYYADGYPPFTPETAQSACAGQGGIFSP